MVLIDSLGQTVVLVLTVPVLVFVLVLRATILELVLPLLVLTTFLHKTLITHYSVH